MIMGLARTDATISRTAEWILASSQWKSRCFMAAKAEQGFSLRSSPS